MGMRRTAHRLWLSVFLALLASAPAFAHELGTIQVKGTFLRDGTYRIDVSVDEEHVPPAAATSGPGVEIAGLTPGLARLAPFFRSLAGTTVLAFDGRPVAPRLEAVQPAPDPSDPFATVPKPVLRFSGPIPGEARTFTWRNGLALGSYPLSLANEGDASPAYQWLEGGGAASAPFVLAAAVVPPTRGEVVRQYLALGFTHILPKGLDHILFVLGIFLLSRRLKPVLAQVTAFTVAHTITLALSIYGVVSLPPRIVEPLIALSIVYVAVENILSPELKASRIALVFGFGLLHGMGFAGVLSELGLPRTEFLPALLSFNLGVEAGQLAVIAIAFLLVGLPWGRRPWYRRWMVVPASCAIALVGLYWSIQRLFP